MQTACKYMQTGMQTGTVLGCMKDKPVIELPKQEVQVGEVLDLHQEGQI